MFTGIVQEVGRLREKRGDRLVVEVPKAVSARLAPGKSIAVNGACLTVRELAGPGFIAEISPETARRTTLGGLPPGTRVNLELPLRVQDGLDGHILLGHIDTLGRVKKIVREGGGWRFTFSYPPEFARYLVDKGAIAVDGISLTPFGVNSSSFSCAVIEETFSRTNLKDRHPGDAVNLEFDILAKYVKGMIGNVH